MRLLLTAPGINVNAVDKNGWTPLHVATLREELEVTRLLLTAPGINVNAVTPQDSYTPLHYAALSGQLEAVRLLLAAPGVNVNVVNYPGETPITIAFERGHHAIVTLLGQAGAQLPAYLQQQGAMINNNQSVHTVSVHVSVSNSALALKKHYKKYDCVASLSGLITWAERIERNTQATPEEKAAARGVLRLKEVDFQDRRSGVTLKEAMALVWLGINDKEEAVWKGSADPKETLAEKSDRRDKILTQGFYEIQRGYNLNKKEVDNGKADKQICTGGTFNNVIHILNGRHSKVAIYFVTPKTISVKAPFFMKEIVERILQTLPENEQIEYRSQWKENIPDVFYDKYKNDIESALKEALEKELKHNFQSDYEKQCATVATDQAHRLG